MALHKSFVAISWGCCCAFLLMFFCVGCKHQVSSYEVERVAAPNGKVEAILTETNGGATTSFGYEVSIGSKATKSSQTVASLYGAVRNTNAYGVNLSWAGNHLLRVEYLRAEAVHNVLNTVDVNGQQIEVKLQSGVEDPSAPPGGMQYNLQRRVH